MPMDDDILNWTREELIAEVVRLRNGIRAHRTVVGTICAGIIQSFGVCFPNRFRRISQSLPGLSFCAAASSIGSHSTGNFQTRRARMPNPTTLNMGSRHSVRLMRDTERKRTLRSQCPLLALSGHDLDSHYVRL